MGKDTFFLTDLSEIFILRSKFSTKSLRSHPAKFTASLTAACPSCADEIKTDGDASPVNPFEFHAKFNVFAPSARSENVAGGMYSGMARGVKKYRSADGPCCNASRQGHQKVPCINTGDQTSCGRTTSLGSCCQGSRRSARDM